MLNKNPFITIDRLKNDIDFLDYGWAPLSQPLSFQNYQVWINDKYHGDMKYLENHLEIKKNPSLHFQDFKTAFVFSFSYVPHPEPQDIQELSGLRLSLYSQGKDYHYWIKERLHKICEILLNDFPHHRFSYHTDSSPLMERDLAHQAGLGWFGKNSCLISRKNGSLFFISEILTTFSFEDLREFHTSQYNSSQRDISHDFCGKCQKCIDICPTNAIEENKKIDANKCISYLTIETKKIPDLQLREKIYDHFFGCDLCQTICPWNQKQFKETWFKELTHLNLSSKKIDENFSNSAFKDELLDSIRFILTASGKQLQKKLANSPVSRAGHKGLRRNAIIVATNLNLSELKMEISAWENDLFLGELVKWSLNKLK